MSIETVVTADSEAYNLARGNICASTHREVYSGNTCNLCHIKEGVGSLQVRRRVQEINQALLRRCRRRGILLCMKPELSAQAQRRDASTSQSGPFATE
jgi:hypothetical protein